MLTRAATGVARSTLECDSGHQGVVVREVETDGVRCERAEWRIDGVQQKLKGCMGRPLVSPSFVAMGLPNLRLMVFPDGKEPAKGMRSRRQREQYQQMVSRGPLRGALRLKAAGLGERCIVTFRLSVGGAGAGPYLGDFSEHPVGGCSDFGIDWLDQVEEDGSLTVGVEVISALSRELAGAIPAAEGCCAGRCLQPAYGVTYSDEGSP